MTRLTSLLAVIAALLAPAGLHGALVLEYIQVASITAGPSAGPALSVLIGVPGDTVFLQVALRDTLGAGPEYGQPGTVPWQTNNGNGGPGAVGLAAFFVRFDGLPGVAVNPAPQSGTNARLVDQINYGLIASGSSPPNFTNIGGLLNWGSEPGAVPDPVTHRIALFNLRITFIGAGIGFFHLRDPNPAPSAVDNSLMLDAIPFDISIGTLVSIDNLLFGPTFVATYPLLVGVPEPSSLVLAGGVALALRFATLRGSVRTHLRSVADRA